MQKYETRIFKNTELKANDRYLTNMKDDKLVSDYNILYYKFLICNIPYYK